MHRHHQGLLQDLIIKMHHKEQLWLNQRHLYLYTVVLLNEWDFVGEAPDYLIKKCEESYTNCTENKIDIYCHIHTTKQPIPENQPCMTNGM